MKNLLNLRFISNPTKFIRNFNSRLFDYELGFLRNSWFTFLTKFKFSQQMTLRQHYLHFEKLYLDPKTQMSQKSAYTSQLCIDQICSFC